ncbi:MAG: NVEALA domain-containing protein [Bacteroidales bacterium]|nr:NVEALA domain-containing protein [Bacteroides sp.]MCM1197609.1 NVEALA domain-containing protein [Clostridium sp.]MCM1502613.1 NVEALA domain-containing protein [Bacteroidales bacterium]
MKTKVCVVIGATLIAMAVSLFFYANDQKNAIDDFFNANVEALADGEATKVKQCYTKGWWGNSEYATFCNENTNISTLYPCQSESHGVKGVASYCTL